MSFLGTLQAIWVLTILSFPFLFLACCCGGKRLVEACVLPRIFPSFTNTRRLRTAVSRFDKFVKHLIASKDQSNDEKKASLEEALKQLLASFTVADLKGVLQGTKVRLAFIRIFDVVIESGFYRSLMSSNEDPDFTFQVDKTTGNALLPSYLFPFFFAGFLDEYQSKYMKAISNLHEAVTLAGNLKICVSARWMIRTVFWPMREKFFQALTIHDKEHLAALVLHATNWLDEKDLATLPGKSTGQGRISNKLDGINATVVGVDGKIDGVTGKLDQLIEALSSDRAPKRTGDDDNTNNKKSN